LSNPEIWIRCLNRLERELSAQQFNTWIRPLQAVHDGGCLRLLAPNRFVMDWVRQQYLNRMQALLTDLGEDSVQVDVQIGASGPRQPVAGAKAAVAALSRGGGKRAYSEGSLNADYNFHSHVEGKSNRMARAAARQVGENPGAAYNPLFIYGGVGLGKTHLMHAVGNLILERKPDARVVYIRSENFVQDMVRAITDNAINDFKKHYRSLDALLIDDIQFFAGKTHSQEEFFHTFNTLLDGQRQVIITSDRFPKKIDGVQERLLSRFGCGLTVPVEPPELETRVAILQKKARAMQTTLPDEVAFFVARQIRSNVRDLEGALHRLVASAGFTGRSIDIDLAREALRDVLVLNASELSVQNIQRTVAEYYKIRLSDLNSPRRTRQITRPRQMAMALAKELTELILPEIGNAFGGRDHTTVLHACRKVGELIRSDERLAEDYRNLMKILRG
jgi:chromosomal replication initiator protein